MHLFFSHQRVFVSANKVLSALQWRHNECDGVSNHRRFVRLLNHMFRRRSKKISKLRVTGLCEGNPPVTGGFPSQGASNAENVSIWWRVHVRPGYDAVPHLCRDISSGLANKRHFKIITFKNNFHKTESLIPCDNFQDTRKLGIIAQVYRLSAVHCQVTRYSQTVPGYLTRYSRCQPMKSLLTKNEPIRVCLSTDVRPGRTLFSPSTWWLQQAFLKA